MRPVALGASLNCLTFKSKIRAFNSPAAIETLSIEARWLSRFALMLGTVKLSAWPFKASLSTRPVKELKLMFLSWSTCNCSNCKFADCAPCVTSACKSRMVNSNVSVSIRARPLSLNVVVSGEAASRKIPEAVKSANSSPIKLPLTKLKSLTS